MPYPFVIMPDVEEGVTLDVNSIGYAFTQDQVDRCVRDCSNRYPNSAIVVYEMKNMMKIRRKAEYQKYVRDTNTGEIVPA